MKPVKKPATMMIPVPYAVLEECARMNCCDTLNMHEPTKSKGMVIDFGGAFWVCFGSTSRYLRYLECDMIRCVPEDEYQGPPHKDGAGPEEYYHGGRLTCKGQAWIMTDEEIRLVDEA